jgi:hypothetical protein
MTIFFLFHIGKINCRMIGNFTCHLQVLNLLLILPVSERDVYEARKTFSEMDSVDCVWSGSKIKTKFVCGPCYTILIMEE